MCVLRSKMSAEEAILGEQIYTFGRFVICCMTGEIHE